MQGWAKPIPAAEYAGVKPRTLRSWLRRGLPHSRLSSGLILIKLTDLDAYITKFREEADEVDKIVEETMKELRA